MAHRYNAIYNALQINAIHRYNGVAVGERAAGDEARFGGRGVGAVRRIAAREYPRRYADQALMIRPSRRVAAPVPGLLLDGISQMRNGRWRADGHGGRRGPFVFLSAPSAFRGPPPTRAWF